MTACRYLKDQATAGMQRQLLQQLLGLQYSSCVVEAAVGLSEVAGAATADDTGSGLLIWRC
jgi:hypothetical protein